MRWSTDPLLGGLAPVINLWTSYEQQPDGSYRQGRVYTQADNPISEQAERLLAALEGGRRGAGRPPESVVGSGSGPGGQRRRDARAPFEAWLLQRASAWKASKPGNEDHG